MNQGEDSTEDEGGGGGIIIKTHSRSMNKSTKKTRKGGTNPTDLLLFSFFLSFSFPRSSLSVCVLLDSDSTLYVLSSRQRDNRQKVKSKRDKTEQPLSFFLCNFSPSSSLETKAKFRYTLDFHERIASFIKRKDQEECGLVMWNESIITQSRVHTKTNTLSLLNLKSKRETLMLNFTDF